MSVASQMLLNQVTIFNPNNNGTLKNDYVSYNSTYQKSEYKHNNYVNNKYSFGWNDPKDIYK
jgi:hypothetical protein